MNKTTVRNFRHHKHGEYDLQKDLARIKAAFSDIGHDIKGKSGELYGQSVDELKTKSAVLQKDMNKYVTKYPLKSMGVALAAGIILGLLLRK